VIREHVTGNRNKTPAGDAVGLLVDKCVKLERVREMD